MARRLGDFSGVSRDGGPRPWLAGLGIAVGFAAAIVAATGGWTALVFGAVGVVAGTIALWRSLPGPVTAEVVIPADLAGANARCHAALHDALASATTDRSRLDRIRAAVLRDSVARGMPLFLTFDLQSEASGTRIRITADGNSQGVLSRKVYDTRADAVAALVQRLCADRAVSESAAPGGR